MSEITQTLQELGSDAQHERREMRIEMVRRLMIRGVKSPIEIQRSLASMDPPVIVTTRTIFRYKSFIERRDIKAVREKEGLNKTVEEMALELKNTFEEVTREMWKQYHAPIRMKVRCPHTEHNGNKFCGLYAEILLNAATIKVSALKEIRETASKHLDVMQSLGLVGKAPEKHQMVDAQGNPVDPIGSDTVLLNQQFIAFVKAQYQDPVGVSKGVTPKQQSNERN